MWGLKSYPTAAHSARALNESFCMHSPHCVLLCVTLTTSEEFLTTWVNGGCDPTVFICPQN